MENTLNNQPFNQLPESWQETIRELRAENARLRIRAKEDLVGKLRAECARSRVARNQARAEAAVLRAELAALREEAGTRVN